MVAPRVIGNNSALPDKIKKQTLTQEIIRMMRNTSEKLREGERAILLSRFAWKLMLSGYDSKVRREIIVAGMKGFEKLVEMDKRGVRSLYRNRWENFKWERGGFRRP